MTSRVFGIPGAKGAVSLAPSALDRLRLEPTRFSLDQAAAVIAPERDPTEIAYRTVDRLGAPAGEVTVAHPERMELHTPTFGLTGPGGVLPRHYTAAVAAQTRGHSPALQAFFDLLSGRFTGLYVKAGAKSRPTRDPRPATKMLAAAVGLGTPHLAEAMATPLQVMLHHAGALSNRTCSAERLRSMIAAETGDAVEIAEFAGGWVRLPDGERTKLSKRGQAGQHSQLSKGAMLGAQVWDPSARVIIRLGPLTLAEFKRRLPGTALHTRLVELTRLHVGMELDFAFNLVLEGPEVPPLELMPPSASAPRLGWTSWLTAPRPRRAPAPAALLPPQPAMPKAFA